MDFDQLKQWATKAQLSDQRKDKRMDEYYCLVNSIDKLCGQSNSKLATAIGVLIDKHYDI